ncbi:MAG: hypothetical protein WC775_03895 [Patescibacteria group bacterium]|jgi:hypothetical protein
MIKLLADNAWIGNIQPPIGSGNYDTALLPFINNLFKLVFVGFGLYALVNFVLAAFNYINAGGEAKNIEKAKKMISQSVVGLLLLSVSFIFAGVIGAVFFGNWNFILDPVAQINNIHP